MKKLLFAISIITLISISEANAQKQAQQDNGQFITVVQSTANHQVHYTLTNKNSVAMDFSLYKEVSNGSWDITHHLNLQPGESYEDVNSFTGLTGKYAVYSAPHSDWAAFPSQFDIAKLLAGGGSATAAPAAATPGPGPTAPVPTAPSPGPGPTAPVSTAPSPGPGPTAPVPTAPSPGPGPTAPVHQ
jgi:hypothetical protein